MKSKLRDYFIKAKGKRVYHSATILDPRIKNSYAKKAGKASCNAVMKNFLEDLKPFEKSQAVAQPAPASDTSSDDEDNFTNDIYKKTKVFPLFLSLF